jgi:hypothetical protein
MEVLTQQQLLDVFACYWGLVVAWMVVREIR